MKLLKFYADWCNPCKQLSRVLEGMEIPPSLTLQPIDVDSDEADELTEKFNVRGLPTLLVLNEQDEEVERLVGGTTAEELKVLFDKYGTK